MMWRIEIKHDGLNKSLVVRGESKYQVEQAAERQLKLWEEEWQESKERKIQISTEEAEEKTNFAKEKFNNIENFLKNSLNSPNIVWEDGKYYSLYAEPKPEPPLLEFNEKKPSRSDFPPKIGLFEKRNVEKVEAKKKLAEEEYYKAVEEYNKKLSEYEVEQQKYNRDSNEWKNNEKKFYSDQKNNNEMIDNNKIEYENGNASVVSALCNIVLEKSNYIEEFPKKFSTEFNPENNILIVDFTLPSIETMPKYKEVRYNKSKDVFTYSNLSDSSLRVLYDDLLYQIVLGKINELYRNDYQELIMAIVFNGFIDTINRGTGKDITLCILSIQTSREEFLSLDLNRVDPKECFRKLKGVGSTKLHTITPIAPLLQMDKTDKRFISSYDVIEELDDSENLALMDWEDFEHLIREIFEKEFSQNGGEVKVTQSSRDGGVDAIAFDPDPIRGGKIVIQAKRYTNVVGVAAVRDLFGTVHSEGAIKGIIVTTSNYGTDAYEFAKDKPLTLLNGSNLLHLLEKHGQKAKIDLKEARRILDQNK